jgi:phosphotransferase system enzyme I (PtsI)
MDELNPPGAALVIQGLGVGRGVALAPLAVVRPAPKVPADEPGPVGTEATAQAVEQVQGVLAEVAAALRAQSAAAGGALGDVLAATAAIAADPALVSDARRRIEAGSGPAGAVHAAVESFAEMFTAAGGYLAERVTDLRSVRDRAIARILSQPEPGLVPLDELSVIAAVDLSPADTAALDLSRVAAIVTEQGGPTGHTAIIAGQLGLPCVVRAAGVTDVPPGTLVGVDAAAGTVTIDPPDALREQYAVRVRQEAELSKDTAAGATADGHAVMLLANIGTIEDARRAAATAAEGVGLFRTEVLFLGRQSAPTLEEQTSVYREVLEAFAGRKVVVRTLDAGADKPLAFATQPAEENPALGVRGYRLVRILPELVETQLAALAAAIADSSAEDRARLWVMAPMVATTAEAAQFAAAARGHGLESVGVMVEVPAAALRAERLLGEVDFASLGTNDLAQYTMATDRLRGELADLLDPWQPAVLELVGTTARAGLSTGRPVGVCGESASDPLMALVLAGLGITSLSMAPAAIPAVRVALRRHTLEQCRGIAAAALAAPDAVQGRAAVLSLVDAGVRSLLGLV